MTETNIWLGNAIPSAKSVTVIPGPNILQQSPPPAFYIGLTGVLFLFEDGWDAQAVVDAWSASDNTAIQAITATIEDGGVNVRFTANDVGVDFDLICNVKDAIVNSTSSYQQLDIIPAPSGGSFKLTVAGSQTASINFNATPATFAASMQSAIAAMSGFSANDVLVTVKGPNSFLFDFSHGKFIGLIVDPITATHTSFTGGDATVQIAVESAGAAAVSGTDEVVTLSFPADGTHTANITEIQEISTTDALAGGFTIAIDGYGKSDILLYTVGRSQITTAIEGLVGHGNVEVTGGPLWWPETETHYPIRIEFIGELAGIDIPEIEIDTIDATQNEIQSIRMTKNPTAGTFTLTYDGQTTGTIAYDAEAVDIQTALVALSNIGSSDVECVGGPLVPSGPEEDNPFTVTNEGGRFQSGINVYGVNPQNNFGIRFKEVHRDPTAPAEWYCSVVPTGFVKAGILRLLCTQGTAEINNASAIGDTAAISGTTYSAVVDVIDADVGQIPVDDASFTAAVFYGSAHTGDITKVVSNVASFPNSLFLLEIDVSDLIFKVMSRDGYVAGTPIVLRVRAGAISSGNSIATKQGNTDPFFGDLKYAVIASPGPDDYISGLPTFVITNITGDYGPIDIYFKSALAEQDLPQITANSAGLTNGKIITSTIQNGFDSAYTVTTIRDGEVGTVENIIGGTFSLVIAGQTVAGIPFDVTADALETAINVAFGSTVCSVTGGPAPSTPLVITFEGVLADQPVTIEYLNGLETSFPGSVKQEVLEDGELPGSPTNIWNIIVAPGVGTLSLSEDATMTLALSNPFANKIGSISPSAEAILHLNVLSPETLQDSINEILADADACRVTKVGNSVERYPVSPLGSNEYNYFWFMKDTYRIVFTTKYDNVQLSAYFTGASNAASLLGYDPETTPFPDDSDSGGVDQFSDLQRVALGFAQYEATAPLQYCSAVKFSGNIPANSMGWRFKLEAQSNVLSGNWAVAEGGKIQFVWGKVGAGDEFESIVSSVPIDWDSPANQVQATIESMFFGTGNIEVLGGLRNSWLPESRLDAPFDIYQELQVTAIGVWYGMPLDDYGYQLRCLLVEPDTDEGSATPSYTMSSNVLFKTTPPILNRRERVTLDPTQLLSLRIGSCATIVDIPLSSTADQIQTLLNAAHAEYVAAAELADLPDKFKFPIFVYGDTFAKGPMEFEFSGGGGQRNPQCQLIVDSLSTVTIGKVVITTPGVLGHGNIDAEQLIQIVGDPYSGTFTLTFGAQTTASLAYNVSLATLQSAVVSAGGWSSPTITGNASIGFTVVWGGAGGPRAAITSVSALNNAGVRKIIKILNQGGFGSTFRIKQNDKGGGPNNLDDAKNWSLNRCLNTTDIAVFDDSSSPVLYGLDCSSVILIQLIASGTPTLFAHKVNRQVFDEGQAVVLLGSVGAVAPAGMTFGVVYRVIEAAEINVNTFRLIDPNGVKVVCTAPNTGELTLSVQNLQVKVYNRLGSAQIGLPHLRDGATLEPLPQYFRAGFDSIDIGLDTGDGLALGCFDAMESDVVINVNATGKALVPGIPPVLFITNSDEASLKINNGDVGLAIYAEQEAVIGNLEAIQGSLKLGNCTIDTLKIAAGVEWTTTGTVVTESLTVG